MKTHEDFLNTHTKNMETMATMNRLATNVMQSVTSMQTQYMQQFLNDMQEMFKELQKDPGEKLSQMFSKTADHTLKVVDLATNAHKDAVTLIHDHVQNHMKSTKKH